ncbi:MBL fold metallo-hydrolase [Mastigocoleus testarum]|uniref:MBL fold metallo-hydrolase n=1 Tax=Mastigocoleus testarum BC008 TaxID=371196 RepID=A0A0V7ZMX6_9CYAN|nr:MBL fold metallo-hydrolase [Mastigocoleus testarum]KST65758.1 MBL fold metallo-hydrolase [Mastigocoleus testarum BC008]
MTKLLFLGSGCAFIRGVDNYQSNILLTSDTGKKFLIDCGSDIRHSLYRAGYSHLDITDIYISHIHADHVGGLEYIGFSTKFDSRCEKPKLYLDTELAQTLWVNSLSGGMKYIGNEIATFETFFEIVEIKSERNFIWENIKFNLIKVVHVNSGNAIMPSYGLFFEINGIKILLTTDTKMCLNILDKFYQEADIIFQDCETTKFSSNVHAHYQELLNLPLSIKNKMWLYHYQPGTLPDAIDDGFCGFVERGQEFDFSSPIFSSKSLNVIKANAV